MKEEAFNNLFKTEAEQAADQPPKHLWDRLDSKLEARRSEKRMIFFRRTAIAASIALVIGLAATLPIFNPKANQLVNADHTGPLTAMNDEVIVNDFTGGFIMTKAEQEAYYESLDGIKAYNTISRNDNQQLAYNYEPNKELKAKKVESSTAPKTESLREIQDAPPSAPNNFDMAMDSIIETSIAVTSVEALEESSGDIQVNAVEDTLEEELISFTDKGAGLAKDQVPSSPNIQADEEALTAQEAIKVKAEQTQAERERLATASKKASKAERDRKSRQARGTSPRTENDAEIAPAAQLNTIDLDLGQRSIDYLYTNAKADQPAIAQLQWILGKWSDPSGKSYETWEQTDELTIEGKGYFIVNQDTLFTERMQIQQLEDGLYFIVAIDESQQKRYFRLKSMQNFMAVFEDRDGSNDQLILERQSDDQFTTIIQNTDVNQLNESQQNFLNNRNFVAPNNHRATRSLNRVQH